MFPIKHTNLIDMFSKKNVQVIEFKRKIINFTKECQDFIKLQEDNRLRSKKTQIHS